MRSGARGPDSEVVIGDGVAWTLHTTTVGYVCAHCGDSCPPGAEYWNCHGAEIGRLCPWCFRGLYDPSPLWQRYYTAEEWQALKRAWHRYRRQAHARASARESAPLYRYNAESSPNVPSFPLDGYYSPYGPSPTWIGLSACQPDDDA
jgi:hypothetical protein